MIRTPVRALGKTTTPKTWLAGLLLVVLSLPSSSHGQEITIDQVTVGLDGYYQVGHLTPVRVEFSSPKTVPDAQLEITVPDDEGIPSSYVSGPLRVAAGSNQWQSVVKFGRVNSSLQIRIRTGDGAPLVEHRIHKSALPDAVLGSQDLVLTLGPDVAVAETIAMRREQAEQETIHGQIQVASALPHDWLGYSGVRLLVFPTGSESLLWNMSAAQLEALDRWVRMGGRLILSSGSNARDVIGDGSPLAALAPGDFDRVQMQRQTSGMENYAGKTQNSLNYYVAEGEIDFRMPMAALDNVVGDVVVAEGFGAERTASIIRSSHGLGHVIFVAVDLDQGPMSRWTDGRRRVLAKLIDLALGEAQRDENEHHYSQLTQIGFDDLSGQLRAALDQFDGVQLVPFSWIALLVAAYILLIGPLDYFLLRRWNKRFHLTWLTFPLIVLVGCGFAHAMTQLWKGQSVRVNQVEIVDIDAQTQLGRTMTWTHVFSPVSQRYRFSIEPTQQIVRFEEPYHQMVGWHGLAGRSFGGMNTQRINEANNHYRIVDVTDAGSRTIQLQGMPIDVYSSRSLSGRVWGRVDLGEVANLTADANRQLSGQVRNPLSVDLRDCLLCYGRGAYPLGTVAAGNTVQIDRFSDFKTIDGLLTRTRVDQDYKMQSQPWDRKSFDVNRILEIMMFHKAAGGGKYTSLLHRYQSEVDFTDHLTAGKALLIGQTREPATSLLGVDQQIERQTTTYVRVLVPVSPYRPVP